MENKGRVLIIDDEEVVLDSCTEILEGENYEVATVTDGTAGLELVDEFGPDLVIVDLKMPGISGFEVLEELQERDPSIVTVVITGYATVSSAVDAMKRGAYDFLPKPFTPDEFRLITRRGMEKRALVEEAAALRREREVLRENFAAIVSHELKSPLSAVQQNLFALVAQLSDRVTEDQQRRLERMKSRIDDLLKLINTLHRGVSTNFTTIRQNFGPVAIDAPVAKAVESIEPHATRKDIEIVTDVPKLAGQVLGDEGTLTEALVNILGNAVKYSYQGSEVHLRVDRRGEGIVISVSDTGVGIPEEDRARIFDDFYRAQSAEAAGGGAGIGLAISRRIVEAHDGSISVESEPGQGSTFAITLPALKADSNDEHPVSSQAGANSPKGAKA